MPKIIANNPLIVHLVLRFMLGIIFLSHGIARIWWGRISVLAGTISSISLPGGHLIAWIITIGEIVGGLMLIFGFWIRIAVFCFFVEIVASIWLVHWKHGWFSVGFGVNGIEYPVVILATLCALFFTDR